MWKDVSAKPPEIGTEVLGFNEEWIDEDYNPDGICLCCLNDEGYWTIAKWCNYHEEYHTGYSKNWTIKPDEQMHIYAAPTQWTVKPMTPGNYSALLLKDKEDDKAAAEIVRKAADFEKQKAVAITIDLLLADGWVKTGGSVIQFEKKIENRNPLNGSAESDIALVLHRMFNEPMFAIVLPDGGMVNFVANSMGDLKKFEESILFFDPNF